MMTALELGESGARVLIVGGDLAKRFGGHVICVDACQPAPIGFGDMVRALATKERDFIAQGIKVLEPEFWEAE